MSGLLHVIVVAIAFLFNKVLIGAVNYLIV